MSNDKAQIEHMQARHTDMNNFFIKVCILIAHLSNISNMSKETNRSERFAQLVGLELKGNFASRNISQTKIADELGHSRSGYSKWLNAKPSIPLEALLNTCELIDADPRSVIDSAYSRLISEMGERRLVPNSSVSDSSASNASSASTSADYGSAQSASNASPSSNASSASPSATDDDYISHIADLIAADPSRFALMAHTDPNKFLESSTPRD